MRLASSLRDRCARASLVGFLALTGACSGDAHPPSPAGSSSSSAASAASTLAPPSTSSSGTAPSSAPPEEPSATAKSGAGGDVYRGVIDPDLPIVMRLRHEGDGLKGSYFYEKKGLDIVLAGTVAKDGTLALFEMAGTKKTGGFSGRIAQGGISGTWSDAAGGRARPFHVTAVSRSSAGPPWIARKWLRSRKKAKESEGGKGLCALDMAYPEIVGAAEAAVESRINEALRRVRRTAGGGSLDDECLSSDKVEGDYAVHLNRSGVLSVAYDFKVVDCEKCAYPAYGGASATFLLTTGEGLPLARLLLPGGKEKLRKMLEKTVKPRILAQDKEGADFLDQVLDAYLEGDYVLTDDALRLIALYRLPHAIQAMDGEAGISLPYDTLKGILDPKSPAAPVWTKP